MASSQDADIYKLTFDELSAIMAFAPMADIHSFRLANHWAERNTFVVFARRGFREVDKAVVPGALPQLKDVFTNTPDLKAYIHSLRLNFAFYSIRTSRTAIKEIGADVRSVKLMSIIASLPKLQTLSLARIQNAAATYPDWPAHKALETHQHTDIMDGLLDDRATLAGCCRKLRKLELQNMQITSLQLVNLLEFFATPAIKTVILSHITVPEMNLGTLLSCLPQFNELEELRLAAHGHFVEWTEVPTTKMMHFTSRSGRYDQTLRSVDGRSIEQMMFISDHALMKGERAVKLGVEKILKEQWEMLKFARQGL